MRNRITVLFVLPLLLLLASCSEYPKILKNNDVKQKLEWAEKLYKKGDFTRAQPLYEQLAVNYRGTALAENMHYYNAYCFYGMKDYEMATYLFKRFCNDFRKSKQAEECNYMFCYTEYMSSLPTYLDQTDTKACMDDITTFIGLYPDSKYIPYCNQLADRLREKLELKAYNTAYLFYKTEEYKAAAISFTNLLKEFPESMHKEESEFYIVKSHYLYAKNSLDVKKKERFGLMMKLYDEYRPDFGADFAKEASKMNEEAGRQIERVNEVK
ncbi:MAG: outer membrane protein assembly factor BamD [Bacteroidetes bacterium]|nr:outer membrane protein assembly factor BamD [Bacteroidota bacterium]